MAGPVPNRSDDLSRKRDANRGDRPDLKAGTLRPVTIPHADPDWHPIARKMWDALKTSGQADFYQNSDWAFAYSLMDDLSMYKKPLLSKDGVEYHKRSGQMLQTIMTSLERLLVTEADRRRARVELSAPVERDEPAAVTAINDYKAGLKGG